VCLLCGFVQLREHPLQLLHLKLQWLISPTMASAVAGLHWKCQWLTSSSAVASASASSRLPSSGSAMVEGKMQRGKFQLPGMLILTISSGCQCRLGPRDVCFTPHAVRT
jgi:hypothetical protein